MGNCTGTIGEQDHKRNIVEKSQRHSHISYREHNQQIQQRRSTTREKFDNTEWLNVTNLKPNEMDYVNHCPPQSSDQNLSNKVHGSMMGMAIGDALGASVEFRPREYLEQNPITNLQGGGTWGLKAGQWTDDTSMALCLAASLICQHGFSAYDQLVRYKWWWRKGYMSSTGHCFDIGKSTKQALDVFVRRQHEYNQDFTTLDLQEPEGFNTQCSQPDRQSNGCLMRLAPIALFFHRDAKDAVYYAGESARTTHGHQIAIDSCRLYAALICAALNGEKKNEILHRNFYQNHIQWFGSKPLDQEVSNIMKNTTYQRKGGYNDGIRGSALCIQSLQAALWAFWSDKNSYESGVLECVNLGDDTDTTAAIYGQLAGAYYGYKQLPPQWLEQIYAREFIKTISDWLVYEGEHYTYHKPIVKQSRL